MIHQISISLRFSLFLSLLWVSYTLAAQPGDATSAVRNTVDLVVGILKDPELKKSENIEKRRSEVMKIIRNRFDFPEMARRSLGGYWRDITDKDREEFIDLFTQLLREAYIGKIEAYTDEKITYKKEDSIAPGLAEVRTFVITPNNEIPVYYRCMLVGKDWKVYDLVIEGVSLVNNYRSQFQRIILRESYKGLITRLKAKIKEIDTTR